MKTGEPTYALTAGTGNDTLKGGTGHTSYSFGSSLGQDTIENILREVMVI